MEPESTVGRFGSLVRPSACLVERVLKQWVTRDRDVHHTPRFLFLPFMAFAHGESLSSVEKGPRNVSGLLQLACSSQLMMVHGSVMWGQPCPVKPRLHMYEVAMLRLDALLSSTQKSCLLFLCLVKFLCVGEKALGSHSYVGFLQRLPEHQPCLCIPVISLKNARGPGVSNAWVESVLTDLQRHLCNKLFE